MKTIRNVLGVVACAWLAAAVAAAGEKPTAAGKAIRNAWPPETLSGKIMMVDSARNLLIMNGPDGVPFDMVVTPSTRITLGDQHKLALKDLSQDVQKNVSVQFKPERSGDIARSIQVTG